MDSHVTKSEVKAELQKQWVTQAVSQALSGRWDEAVETNLHILDLFPGDLPARNRLGKAYLELGRHEEALSAYELVLKQQPSNNIAPKKLKELYALLKREPEIALMDTAAAIEMAGDDYEDIDDVEDYVEEEEPDTGADDENPE